jgi:hypothetical protein
MSRHTPVSRTSRPRWPTSSSQPSRIRASSRSRASRRRASETATAPSSESVSVNAAPVGASSPLVASGYRDRLDDLEEVPPPHLVLESLARRLEPVLDPVVERGTSRPPGPRRDGRRGTPRRSPRSAATSAPRARAAFPRARPPRRPSRAPRVSSRSRCARSWGCTGSSCHAWVASHSGGARSAAKGSTGLQWPPPMRQSR